MSETLHHKKPLQRGAALPLVLFALLFMTLLGFMAMNTASVEVRLAANERDYQQAVYVAEGGIAHTRAILKSLLNVCNQSTIASGGDVTWTFVLKDVPADCPALAGRPRPLSIQANLGNYQYLVTMRDNPDDTDADPTTDGDQKILITSMATGPNSIRAGIDFLINAENSTSEVSGYSGQFGAGSGKNFTGRDSKAITDMTSKNLGNL